LFRGHRPPLCADSLFRRLAVPGRSEEGGPIDAGFAGAKVFGEGFLGRGLREGRGSGGKKETAEQDSAHSKPPGMTAKRQYRRGWPARPRGEEDHACLFVGFDTRFGRLFDGFRFFARLGENTRFKAELVARVGAKQEIPGDLAISGSLVVQHWPRPNNAAPTTTFAGPALLGILRKISDRFAFGKGPKTQEDSLNGVGERIEVSLSAKLQLHVVDSAQIGEFKQ